MLRVTAARVRVDVARDKVLKTVTRGPATVLVIAAAVNVEDTVLARRVVRTTPWTSV